MKIYTKTGDAGDTGLIGGERVSKDDLRFEAVGTVDELNAVLGRCRTQAEGIGLDRLLERIQNLLFDAGAELGGTRNNPHYRTAFVAEDVMALERSIDEQTEALEPLRHFILPGGSSLAAEIHVARTVCRRAERAILRLHRRDGVESLTLVFFNRLSDWLFVAARTANRLAGRKDVIWTAKEV
jgi:cob(I)alamin adenosyltransferase